MTEPSRPQSFWLGLQDQLDQEWLKKRTAAAVAANAPSRQWLDQATAIVAPADRQRKEFIEEYDFAIQRIRDFAPMAEWPSPGRREAEAAGFADAVKAILDRLDKLTPPLKHWIIKGSALGRPADIDALVALEKEARFHSVAPDKKPGAAPLSSAKENAAREAQRLLLVFTKRKRPTSAKDKRFLDLSSLLYQEATGKGHVDLSHYCKGVFPQNRVRTTTNKTGVRTR